MANYSKAFNFRGGFQVDTDVLVVRGQRVGIGSTEPKEVLDVNGVVRATDLEVEDTRLSSARIGILTITDELIVGVSTLDNHGAIIAIGTGIITATSDSVGLVTYYGDGRFLQGLPTSQWVDIDVGLGYTSIYAQGNVGVDTVDPRYTFQVGGVPFVIPAGIATVPLRFNQQGVGIQDGSIYASDDLRVGGGVSITGTLGIGLTVTINDAVSIGGTLNVDGTTSIGGSISVGGGATIGGSVSIGGTTTIGGAVSAGGSAIVGGGASIGGGVSIGGSISIGGTAGIGSDLTVVGFVSAYELSGIGSQITFINADYIAIGSLGSMRYGDVIVTKEVYADRFIGTATSADGLTGGADVDIIGLRALEVEAVTRFISTEGKLQIGTNDPVNEVSDIDLLKAGNVTISGVSTTATSSILVGRERPAPGTRSFGGIRFGGDPGDSTSQPTDLDLVNYDVGNVNSYLHSGSGGASVGSFRWIYGQTDTILATLTKDGEMSIFGNGVSGNTNLTVVGLSSIEALRVGDIAAGVGSVTGDFDVYGRLGIYGGVGVTTDVEFLGATFTDDVFINGDPYNGDIGIKLDADGVITASNNIKLRFTGTEVIDMNPSGDITANGDITAANVTASSGSISASEIEGTTQLTGPSLSNIGNQTTVQDLQVDGTCNLANISAGDITAGDITVNSIDVNSGTQIDSSSITVDALTVNNSLSGNFNISGTPSFTNINASGTISGNVVNGQSGDFDSLDIGNLGVGTIRALGTSEIIIESGLEVQGVSTFSDIDCQALTATSFSTGNLTVNNIIGSGSSIGINTAVNISGGGIDVTEDVEGNDVIARNNLETGNDTIVFSFGSITFQLDNNDTELRFVVQTPSGEKQGIITIA